MNESLTAGISVSEITDPAYAQLEKGILTALERYSNVHRGSGHFSKVSTHLYEKAREIVLSYMGLENTGSQVIFLSPRRAEAFSKMLKPGSYQVLSDSETGLSLGITAVIVKKKLLPKGIPFETGGGTTKLYGPDWVLWARQPDRFEAGTPAIINVIAFARALQIVKRYGKDVFSKAISESPSFLKFLNNSENSDLQGIDLLNSLRQTMIGSDIQVPTTQGLRTFINFDNSASTPAFSPAWEAFRMAMHMDKQAGTETADEVRRISAGFLGAPLTDYEIIFTSGTTESINLAAYGLGKNPAGDKDPVVLTTVLEHSSNDLPWRTVPGHSFIRMEVDNEGVFDLKKLEALLVEYNEKGMHGNKRIKLVAVSGASNVLGTCNDLKAISEIVHRHQSLLAVDAAQLVAHRKISMEATGIDILAFSAHKMYAPFGTGALVVRKGLLQFDKDELNHIKTLGEANSGGIAAMGVAMGLLQRIGFDLIEQEERKLTNKALNGMTQIPGIKSHGMLRADNRHVSKTGVIGFSVKSGMPATVARKLALNGGMGVRFGCLCAHLIIKQLAGFTPFQEKIQRLFVKLFPILNLQGIIRASFGIQNTEADVDALVAELQRIAAKAGKVQKGSHPVHNGLPVGLLSEKEVKKQVREFIEEAESVVFG